MALSNCNGMNCFVHTEILQWTANTFRRQNNGGVRRLNSKIFKPYQIQIFEKYEHQISKRVLTEYFCFSQKQKKNMVTKCRNIQRLIISLTTSSAIRKAVHLVKFVTSKMKSCQILQIQPVHEAADTAYAQFIFHGRQARKIL